MLVDTSNSLTMEKICYNCGTPLTKENATVEHVPAKTLYNGLEPEFKVNRITVPACFECNQMYSKIDQELRDALAVISNNDPEEKKELIGKGIRSILRRSNWKDRFHFNNNGNIVAVDFSYDELRKLHIKNFKALFYRKYGFPVPSDFEIQIIADGDENKLQTAQIIYGYLQVGKDYEFSGHPDIFKFILKDMTPDIPVDRVYESGDFEKLVGVAGLLIYHDDMGAIVVAGKKIFIASCKPK